MTEHHSQRRVMIVDDEAPIRRAVELMLEDCVVRGADSIAAARKLLDEDAHFDVALVDKNLPDGSGLTLLPFLKQYSPTTSVIVVTAYPTLESAIESIELGVFDYLVKPFHIQDLILKVHNAADKAALEAKLRRAERLELIGQLAGSVAHDFNNLLTVLRSYTGFIKEFLLTQKEQGLAVAEPLADVGELLQAYTAVGATTRELLTFSGRQVLSLEPVAVNEVVERMSRTMFRTLKGRVVVETELAPKLPSVLMDAGQCEQMILNLVLNARDAMTDSGTITVVTETDESRQVRIIVRDTGTGIAEEDLERIFEPFFSTKGPERGTGLGLASVRRIAESLGGQVTVRSRRGEGSSFAITLPGLNTPHQAAPIRSDPGPTVHQGKPILVAEDDQAVRESVRRILVRAGYEVFTVSDGCEALDTLKTDKPALAIFDVVMPGPTTPELVAQFRRTLPELRFLLMSADALETVGDRTLVVDGEPLPFLPKPFDRQTLLDAVHRAFTT